MFEVSKVSDDAELAAWKLLIKKLFVVAGDEDKGDGDGGKVDVCIWCERMPANEGKKFDVEGDMFKKLQFCESCDVAAAIATL